MQLACDEVTPGQGCDYIAHGDDVATVHSAMMAHTGQAHEILLGAGSHEERALMQQEMESHIFDLLRIR